MTRLIYTLVYYVLAPLLCFRWLYKSIRPPQYREPFRQRFGFVKRQPQDSVWIHAVSMGEASAAILIIKKLLVQNPKLNLVVTTTTPTGARLIHESLADKVTHYYSPCDLPGTIKRFVKRIRPKLVIIMETELWPNWLAHLAKKQIAVLLVNARLSQKSADSYARFNKLTRKMLNQLTKVLSVSKEDAQRYQSLGLQSDKIMTTGNIKFDASYQSHYSDDYFPHWPSQPIWIAASTHSQEDEIVLHAHKKVLAIFPKAKLIIVPRHPERFVEVAQLIEEHGLSFCRRSKPDGWSAKAEVLLGDSMGELMQAYYLAQVAFVGGSFVNVGGHNGMEPAYLSKPILTGPNIYNFQYLFDALIEANAALMVGDELELAEQLINFIHNPEQGEVMGKNAKQLVIDNQGALAETLKVIESYL